MQICKNEYCSSVRRYNKFLSDVEILFSVDVYFMFRAPLLNGGFSPTSHWEHGHSDLLMTFNQPYER